MRATTVKRLAILIAVLGLIGGTGYFAWGYQIDRMGRSVLEKARLAAEAGKFVEAGELQQYLGVVPDNGDLYKQYLGVVPDDVEVKIKYAVCF